VAGIHPAVRLIHIAHTMHTQGRRRIAQAFLVLAYGLVMITFGYAVLMAMLIYTHAAQSLWPGVILAASNLLLVVGMYMLGRSRLDE